jgi:lipopolysaccharide transport system ATP-binding protein
MYVRLAFGVAAHLEPDIMIVDEVLAVGDTEFQKKALSKMKDVSKKDGRTVLFVSHNLTAIQNLCNNSLYLKNGYLEYSNATDKTLQYYLKDIKVDSKKSLSDLKERKGSGRIRAVDILSSNSKGEETNVFLCGESLNFKLIFDTAYGLTFLKAQIDIGINNYLDDRVAWLSTSMFTDVVDLSRNSVTFSINRLTLVPGNYNINIFCKAGDEILDWIENVFSFDIVESDFYLTGRKIPNGQGHVFLEYKTEFT